MFFLQRLSRRQLFFMFLVLPILPFSSRGLICRSDPIIQLSDGTTLVVGATIDGALEDIKEVHYDVHVPAGLSMTGYESTPLWEKTKETFKLYPDQAPGNYLVTVTIKINHGADNPVADVTLLAPDGSTIAAYTQAGKSGKPMTVSFSAS